MLETRESREAKNDKACEKPVCKHRTLPSFWKRAVLKGREKNSGKDAEKERNKNIRSVRRRKTT